MDTTENEYHYATLPSGLRVVMHHRPGSVAEHCGVAVRAGSRDERPEHYGLAHFVEHTIFKGTMRRRSWHILNRMERIGGELNAYTTKEETVVYTTYPAGHLERAVDLVADLVENSQFPTVEIDRERQVVADEIDTYLDIPSEGIFDDFDELIFAGSPLAHPILGSRESIDRLTTDVCRNYLDEYYTPANMVFFYSGPEKPDHVVRVASRCFRKDPHGSLIPRSGPTPPVPPKADVVKEIGTHQAHTVLGARIHDMYSPRRHAMALLTNILGGPGMNSLLNVALRERRGLVYTVDASASLLSDAGLFTIYYGCDTGDVDRCRRIIEGIIEKQASECMTQRHLEEARRQYIGQLTLASTNTEQRALSMARAMLFRGEVIPSARHLEAIRAITPADLREAAGALIGMSRLTLL
ncbi:pitrilysin family protein [uncultured Duncaniella sp.]|uniref:M16 family metallopeptidase n=1 Tax=uncultured Duncaniella sp. TaxID=2768039 RepID=UPI0026761F54|nr:pitrilysin family protein [uncultured Duncaniella sp.]MCI9171817.1 insulinase family protein [Muribaculaceae bacterium]